MEEIVMEGCLYKSAWLKPEATQQIDASGSDANVYRKNNWYWLCIDNNSNQQILDI